MIRTVIWSIACVLLITNTSSAQPGSGRRGPDLNMFLVALPEVQKELQIERRQSRLIDALQEDLMMQVRNRRLDEDDRAKHNEVARKLWNVLLNKDQSERLAQVRLQFEGLYAVDGETFVDELGLSEDQVAEIRRLRRRRNPVAVDSVLDDVLTDDQLTKWQEKAGRSFAFHARILEFREGYFRFRGRRFGSR